MSVIEGVNLTPCHHSQRMKCNGCWIDIDPRTQAIASSCGHLLCVKCAQSIIESDGSCPICESLITKSTVKLVTILQETAACRLHLCGQTPETALNSALASVNFYLKQQALHFELRENQFKMKLQKLQEQCKQKLAEVHNGSSLKAKRKYQEVMEEKNLLEKDTQELQQKYSQKAMQTRKLQEMITALRSENEVMRTSTGSRHTKHSTDGAFSSSFHHKVNEFERRGKRVRAHSESRSRRQIQSSPTYVLDELDPTEDVRPQRIAKKGMEMKSSSQRSPRPFSSFSHGNTHKSSSFKEGLADSNRLTSCPQSQLNFVASLGSPGRMASF